MITRHPDFSSRYTEPRNVDVWLPQGARSSERFPVIYLHDGQNLFDPELCGFGIDWGVDEAIERLAAAGRGRAAIAVGIWNIAHRWRDYMPAQPLRNMPGEQARQSLYYQVESDPPRSDEYLRFIVEELKPFIDATYPTLPERQHTFVMGSSMGGLISLYALEQYPQVFAGAGCLSTHWPAGGADLVEALGAALPPAGDHRLYFDYGTQGLDADYEPFQLRMDRHLRNNGYAQDIDWITRKFPGADHNEASWRARLDIPLAFLLQA